MIIKTVGLLFLLAGQVYGQSFSFGIPIYNLNSIYSALTGTGGSSNSGSSSGSSGGGGGGGSSNNDDAQADYNAYLSEYYSNYWQNFYQSQALYGPYGPYGPFGPGSFPNGPRPTPAPTPAPTSAPITTSTAVIPTVGPITTSTAVIPTVGPITTSTAVAPTVGPATTSTAVAPVDPATTSTALPTVNTDMTSDAVGPKRFRTTPLPFHYVPGTFLSPYDLHRINSNPIDEQGVGSASSASAAGTSAVYIPYDAVLHRRSRPSPYFELDGKK